MSKAPHDIASDLDRIARLSAGKPDRLDAPERRLLRHAPAAMAEALDVGCGTGAMTRAFAQRGARVLGVDLSPGMIEVARRRSTAYPNIEYLVADTTRLALPAARFDCISTVATLHHLPLRPTLARLATALAPGGVLLVADLLDTSGLLNLPRNALALLVSRLSRPRGGRALRDAWAQHGEDEIYPRCSEIEALAADLLPGAQIRQHLLWRYSLVWTKPR